MIALAIQSQTQTPNSYQSLQKILHQIKKQFKQRSTINLNQHLNNIQINSSSSSSTIQQEYDFLSQIQVTSYSERQEQQVNLDKMCIRNGIQKIIFFKRHFITQQQRCQQIHDKINQQFGVVPFLTSNNLPTESKHDLKKRQKNSFQQSFPLKIKNKSTGLSQQILLRQQDIQKLQPGKDLNDTIIDCYIKLLKNVFLPKQTSESTFIFSSYFLQKLVGRLLRSEMILYEDQKVLCSLMEKQVAHKYQQVYRWTKKINILEKKYLVVPINAFNHWFCLIVLNPRRLLEPNGKSEIIYCDSLFEGREFMVNAVRKYLERELLHKHNIKLDINSTNLPWYQLLLPRQTNKHDCGLYMLAFIQELLAQEEIHLFELSRPENRLKLKLFCRTQIFSMRNRLAQLLIKLIQGQNYDVTINNFIKQKQRVSECGDYDSIDERQLQKYNKFIKQSEYLQNMGQEKLIHLIRFYLDPEINYFETD